MNDNKTREGLQLLCCRRHLVSDKQKCIKTCYKIKNNNKSQVYYNKLYTNVNNDEVDDDNDVDYHNWEEDNIHLFMSPKDTNKKHLIVYYKPTRKFINSDSYFLQNLAHNFMYLCFCRSYHHQNYHYPNRRLGTF